MAVMRLPQGWTVVGSWSDWAAPGAIFQSKLAIARTIQGR